MLYTQAPKQSGIVRILLACLLGHYDGMWCAKITNRIRLARHFHMVIIKIIPQLPNYTCCASFWLRIVPVVSITTERVEYTK